ncbi:MULTISPECIES: hypothetical protein [Streptomyces]|uniref:Uncharacterized protein n=1 Tax=Streptomyces rimosus subsp. rimosus (strain ATCC 10970 / DSM 40260 / JCM 4667 / NRRL 2234) TaxID=1265868 RepID=A0A8A1USZ6_STRR1|nr:MULTISPECIES: hypothetical protein [Streptomyces]KOG70564.1 hypothetical protein ADK78_28695 [Kitasatospora aureofaciens]MYT47350.1 hypothetical protein [Streptomyces sp. SID5471]KEF04680.1 hypothetical protein DF17_22595 [Streptomyces rimosus]KOT31388.1 hypothetical protein ADK84_30210 [Streptomyces sp. NRRL WC-3701]KOT55930.1 hypothetical protein ADK45_28295 [Streptomyces rimosus subsp. rimosus]
MQLTPDQAEWQYRDGRVSQAQYEAYMHAWATSAVRYGPDQLYEREPSDIEVKKIVAEIRLAFEALNTANDSSRSR